MKYCFLFLLWLNISRYFRVFCFMFETGFFLFHFSWLLTNFVDHPPFQKSRLRRWQVKRLANLTWKLGKSYCGYFHSNPYLILWSNLLLPIALSPRELEGLRLVSCTREIFFRAFFGRKTNQCVDFCLVCSAETQMINKHNMILKYYRSESQKKDVKLIFTPN